MPSRSSSEFAGVRAIVIHDDMELQIASELFVQSFKELQELLKPVPGVERCPTTLRALPRVRQTNSEVPWRL